MDKPIPTAWWFLDGTTITTESKIWIAFSQTVRLPPLPRCLAMCLWFLPNVQNTCFTWCALCYPTNAKKHTMDYSDLSKRYMATFQSNVDLSRLWDGSDKLCSISISTCRTSWMSMPSEEKFEVPVFRERSSATLQCGITFCLLYQNNSCVCFCANWQFGRAFDALSSELPNELTPILNWLEDNFICRPGRNNRRSLPALFPPDIWSM